MNRFICAVCNIQFSNALLVPSQISTIRFAALTIRSGAALDFISFIKSALAPSVAIVTA